MGTVREAPVENIKANCSSRPVNTHTAKGDQEKNSVNTDVLFQKNPSPFLCDLPIPGAA